jgi:hypothetical protein
MFNQNQHVLELWWIVTFNGLEKSKFHGYLNPLIDRGYKCGVGALDNAQTQSHAMHCETNC